MIDGWLFYEKTFTQKEALIPDVSEPIAIFKKEKEIIFQYNDELNEFQELEIPKNIQILELFDSDSIFFFVDSIRESVWIWHGRNATTRMKFIAAKSAQSIRDRYGIGFKIAAVEEGDESLGFKVALGIEEEPEYVEAKSGPEYEGTE